MKQYSYCENCFNTDKNPEICGTCIRNPQNVFKHDNFVSYPICCRYGFKYCINDPGYIWKYHYDWFIELYGDISPFEVKNCEDCETVANMMMKINNCVVAEWVDAYQPKRNTSKQVA